MTTESTTAGELTAPASGKHTTDGVPHGYTSLTPFIVVQPATAAIAFYREVFGAAVLSQMPGAPLPDGTPTISHAELDFGQGILQLGDPMEGKRAQAPGSVRGQRFDLRVCARRGRRRRQGHRTRCHDRRATVELRIR